MIIKDYCLKCRGVRDFSFIGYLSKSRACIFMCKTCGDFKISTRHVFRGRAIYEKSELKKKRILKEGKRK